MTTSGFSTPEEMAEMVKLLSGYMKLPFSTDTIPGAIMEAAIAHIKGAKVLNTYDYIDVVDEKNRIGWQVKATKASTPVTWKRAKIPNQEALIDESENKPKEGCEKLGKAIIDFCNNHAKQSLNDYKIDKIFLARLVISDLNNAFYYERLLCTKENPVIFPPGDFTWEWSTPKLAKKKEQLPALHGRDINKHKCWAWHGLGENQLHFSGEGLWWPDKEAPERIDFTLPTEDDKMSMQDFVDLLAKIN
jgi:hypothetical protein